MLREKIYNKGVEKMQQSEVFFIGLGMGGNAIVKELRKRTYDGIMIDCSTNNMNFLKMQQERDYYLLGGTGGTGGQREVGRQYIEKDLARLQTRLKNLNHVKEVVIIACADSGVVGGQEVIVKQIKKYASSCKISFLTILPFNYYFGQLREMIEECNQNIMLMQQGMISNHIYVKRKGEDRQTDIDEKIVNAMDNLFQNDLWVDKMSDLTLTNFREATNNKFIIVGEQRNQLMQELRDKFLELGLDFCDSHMEQIKESLAVFKEKQREREERWKKTNSITKSELEEYWFDWDINRVQFEVKRLEEALNDLAVLKDR